VGNTKFGQKLSQNIFQKLYILITVSALQKQFPEILDKTKSSPFISTLATLFLSVEFTEFDDEFLADFFFLICSPKLTSLNVDQSSMSHLWRDLFGAIVELLNEIVYETRNADSTAMNHSLNGLLTLVLNMLNALRIALLVTSANQSHQYLISTFHEVEAFLSIISKLDLDCSLADSNLKIENAKVSILSLF
jgi:hypothetical protein